MIHYSSIMFENNIVDTPWIISLAYINTYSKFILAIKTFAKCWPIFQIFAGHTATNWDLDAYKKWSCLFWKIKKLSKNSVPGVRFYTWGFEPEVQNGLFLALGFI